MKSRATIFCLLLGALLPAGSAFAYDAYDPNNCNGVDWDDQRALAVSKVSASERVNFIKSPYDNDFKAATCPAARLARETNLFPPAMLRDPV